MRWYEGKVCSPGPIRKMGKCTRDEEDREDDGIR